MIRTPILIFLLTGCLLIAACADLTPVRRVDENARLSADEVIFERTTLNIEKSLARRTWQEGEYWIDQIAAGRSAEFAGWFEPRAQDFPPLWIYAAARKFQQGGNYLKAAYWYIAGRERHIRHLRRCRDDTAKEQLIWADGAFAGLRTEMGRNPDMTRYAAKHGFAWLDLNRDTDLGLLESCQWGERGIARARRGTLVETKRAGGTVFVLSPPPIQNPANWIIPAGEIHQIRTWSRILMKQELAKILGDPKEEPPTPTVMPLR